MTSRPRSKDERPLLSTIARSAVAVFLVLLFSHGHALGQCEGRWLSGGGFPGVSDAVRAMTTWDPDGAGPQPAALVAAGDFAYAGTEAASRIAAWDGSAWRPLGSGFDGTVHALTVYNGELIAAGSFTNSGTVAVGRIARWDGLAWGPVGGGSVAGANAAVHALSVYGGELIAGGAFTTVAGVPARCIARWNGTEWRPVGSLDGPVSATVFALTIYNNRLVAGGNFTSADSSPVGLLASWDGSAWSPLGAGIVEIQSGTRILAMCVRGSELFVAGGFSRVGTGINARNIARWNGSVWQNLGSGLLNTAYALQTHGNRVIAGGFFRTAGGRAVNQVASWSGVDWSAMDGGVYAFPDPTVYALTLFDGRLIAGGTFIAAGGGDASRIGAWDGTKWSAIGQGRLDLTGAYTEYRGELFAANLYGLGDGLSGRSVAGWNGLTWRTLPNAPTWGAGYLAVFQDELYVGGTFTRLADGTAMNNIARWDGATWRSVGAGFPNGVWGLIVHDGWLVASVNNLGTHRWNGSVWQSIGAGLPQSPTNLTTYQGQLIAACGERLYRWTGSGWQQIPSLPTSAASFVEYDGRLIALGNFGSGDELALAWNGTSWADMGLTAGFWPMSERANAGAVYHGRFVVVGAFIDIVPGLFDFVAVHGPQWSPLGATLNNGATAVAVHHNELVVDGWFTHAGDVLSPTFARWVDNPTPWIALQPAATASVAVGDTIALSAAPASGYDFDGPLVFQWRRDGVPIADGPSGASAGGGTVSGAAGVIATVGGVPQPAMLTITGVQASDAGSYDCLISNGCGTSVSEAAVVTISGSCPADLVADGVVDFTDYLEFLNLFEALDPRVDFLLDGVIDFSDYLEFLNHFDAGC